MGIHLVSYRYLTSSKWFTAERVSLYTKLLLFYYITVYLIWLYFTFDSLGPNKAILGADFISFYAAGQLAMEGNAAQAYNVLVHKGVELEIISRSDIYFELLSFSYPPIFLLLLAPLSKLPFVWAYFLFQLTTLGLFLYFIFRITESKKSIIIALAFPAVMLNFNFGQNAYLTAGLLAGFLFFFEKKPLISGFFLGCLTFKPHLGVLIPIVLIISGQWRVFFSAMVVTIILFLCSVFWFGAESWLAFWDGKDVPQRVLEDGVVPYSVMQSFFTGMRSLGASLFWSYTLHLLFAIITSFFILKLWILKIDYRLKAASLAIGTLILSPYILHYDLTILAVVLAFVVRYCQDKNFPKGMINLLSLIWLYPLFIKFLNSTFLIPWTPIILLLILLKIVHMAKNELYLEKQNVV